MTPLSSLRQNTANHFFNTSTTRTPTFNSQLKSHQQGTVPFLDTLVIIAPNNTFTTSVYRKPIHRDQYLNWDSNHIITAKESVYNTLAHRAKVVSSNQEELDQELLHIRKALHECQFPNWALNQLQHKFQRNN